MTDEEWFRFEGKLNGLQHELKIFMSNLNEFFSTHPDLNDEHQPVVHSTKFREKSRSHIRTKIDRKNAKPDRNVTPENIFHELSDLVGVRLLLLFQTDFSAVHDVIDNKVSVGDWHLRESPKAFTWDPENANYFRGLGLEVESRETFYTSVHYIVSPRKGSDISCEIQVRTLFEETWGEVDHRINYPNPTDSIACKEQLMVLSKIAGAGSRLVDSIDRTLKEPPVRKV